MEIFFCDICSESVPQSHLDEGKAVRRGERVMCLACDQSMSGIAQLDANSGALVPGAGGTAAEMAAASSASPGGESTEGFSAAATIIDGGERPRLAGAGGPPFTESGGTPFHDGDLAQGIAGAGDATGGGTGRRRNRQGMGAMVLGLLALGFAAVSASMLHDQLEELRTENVNLRGELDLAQSGLRRDVNALQADFEEDLAGQGARLRTRQDEALARWGEAIGGLEGELKAATKNMSGLGDDLAEMRGEQRTLSTSLDQRLATFFTSIEEQKGDVAYNYNKSIELEERLHALSSGSGLMAAAGGRAIGGGNQPGNEPAWHALLPDLNSPQDGLRLEAIYALGDTGDTDVVPYIIPMLKDVDLFVRMATCRTLEDLKARSAVPALIDALEDQETAVQESAMIAVQRITSQNFGFEPNQSGNDRAKKIKVWRDWWKKNGDQFSAAGA